MTYQSVLCWAISQGSNSSAVTAEKVKPYSRVLCHWEKKFHLEAMALHFCHFIPSMRSNNGDLDNKKKFHVKER